MGGVQPGQHRAQIQIEDDTPQALLSIPITLTVDAPPTWGKLAGTVTSVGENEHVVLPLANAQILVESQSSGETWTLRTDSSGTYQLWLDAAHSPLTLTLIRPRYAEQPVRDVIIRAQQTTTYDFALAGLKITYLPILWR
jgi:hypothetical protein